MKSKLVLPSASRDHIRGSIDAPLALIEYGDYECPYCGEAEASAIKPGRSRPSRNDFQRRDLFALKLEKESKVNRASGKVPVLPFARQRLACVLILCRGIRLPRFYCGPAFVGVPLVLNDGIFSEARFIRGHGEGSLLQKSLDDRLRAANKIFDDDRLTLEEKLLQALDERFGRYAGVFHPDASDIVTECERILGDAVGKNRSALQRKLETAVLASSAKKTKGAEKRAATIANILCTCGLTWQSSLSSQQEFSEKMRDAIHLCCRDQ